MSNKLLGNKKRGELFILSAPAGTGKTTLAQMLKTEFSCVITSISFTTRSPREGERDGVDYNFISKEAFRKKIDEGEFLEHVELYGDYYGSSRSWVEKKREEGYHVILVIDTQGALLLKGKIPFTSIFIAPPSMEELKRRLTGRHTEDSRHIRRRLEWAEREMSMKQHYDYEVVNDNLETAYQILRSILIAEEHKLRKKDEF